MKDEIDTALNDFFESLKPSPEEVQAMINQWPDETERALQLGWAADLTAFFSTADLNTDDESGDDGAMERALDMFADFIDRTDPEKN